MTNRQKEIAWLIRDKYDGLSAQAGEKPADKTLAKDLRRLRAGEPVDYVIGWKEFLGCRIDLSEKPLIPREETEYWVNLAPRGPAAGREVLDIFSGSGCIGLAILKRWPKAKVTFVDKSLRALKQIKINLRLNKAKGKVIQSDIFSKVTGRFDYIFANPPYVPSRRKLSKSVVKYEPKSALFAGVDGLVIIKKFLAEARNHLKAGGQIFMEIDSSQKNKIEKLAKQFGYSQATFHRDQFGRWRWVEMR